MLRGVYCIATLVMMCGLLASAKESDQKKNKVPKNKQQVKVEVQGKLRHGIVAIGGETTGTLITADKVTWELDLGKDPKHLNFAEEFNGKLVNVSGTLEVRKGVEIPNRWIVTVSCLKATKKDAKAQFVKVQAKGLLRHGVLVIGGETTGTTIAVGNIRWEIDLRKNKQFPDTAQSLHGKTALVHGTLKIMKGVEVPKRWIVTATKLKATD